MTSRRDGDNVRARRHQHLRLAPPRSFAGPRTPLRAWAFAAILAVIGCADRGTVWRESANPLLKEMPLADDQIVLEIAFVTVPGGRESELDPVWNHADEQVVPVAARRALNRNGLRIGVLGLNLPDELRALVDESTDEHWSLPSDFTTVGTEIPVGQRVLRARIGQPHDIVTSSTRESLTYFLASDGSWTGKTVQQAQPLLRLVPVAHRDGGVALRLLPEIQHGQVKQRYAAREGALRLEAGRERVEFPELAAEFPLRVGQTAIVGMNGDSEALGATLFRGENQRKLLLVRLARAQQTDLFGESAR